MKKAVSVLLCILFVLMGLRPAGKLLAWPFGYRFEIAFLPAFVAGCAVLSVELVLLSLFCRDAGESKLIRILSDGITPLAVIHTVGCLLSCEGMLITVCAFCTLGSCVYFAVRFGRGWVGKLMAVLMVAFLLSPLGLFFLLMTEFGQNTVVKTVESPDGSYSAQIIDSDQGALGGATYVEVVEKGVDLFLFYAEKAPCRIYSGGWGEAEGLEVVWKDDTCLVINGREYPIE